MGNGAVSSRVKWAEREAEQSLISIEALQNEWRCTFSLICLRGACRENFTFTLHLNCKKSLYQLATVNVKLSLSTP